METKSCTIIFVLGLSFFVCPCFADLLKYSVSYDPTTQVTALYNDLSSETGLQFRTKVGPDAFVEYGLSPGTGVSIDDGGNITVTTGESSGWWEWLFGAGPWNKPLDGQFTVTGRYVMGQVSVKYNDPIQGLLEKKLNYGDYCVIPRCTPFLVYIGGVQYNPLNPGPTVATVTGCDIDQSLGTIALYNSPSWGGNPDQASVSLIEGTVWNTEDTSEAISIITPTTWTDCPEPATLLLLGLGGLMLRKRRV